MIARRGKGSAAGTPRARLPLLERLMDEEDEGGETAPPTPSETLEALKSAVQRSLEHVLNARRRRLPVPANLVELRQSIFTFGIPDPAAGTYNLAAQREAVAREVEATLRRFEPRLTQIRVQLAEDVEEEWGRLRLRVEAVLQVDPVIESVHYETVLEPVSRQVTVREGMMG